MTIRIQNDLNLGGLIDRVAAVAPDALDEAAKHVLKVSQGRAPLLVDVQRANRQERPGTLRESGYTRVVDDSTAEVGYKDFIAARQHEDMDLHHDVGVPKFLEGPMVEEKDEVLRIIARRVGEAL